MTTVRDTPRSMPGARSGRRDRRRAGAGGAAALPRGLAPDWLSPQAATSENARMAEIQDLDFLGIPTQDPERARTFYREVLGMRPDPHAQWEQWAGNTCFALWEPERNGMPFVAQQGNPIPLRTDDVEAMRAELEAKGVTFFGPTMDTGVCHMAFFADPDGNALMLHRRYAPYAS